MISESVTQSCLTVCDLMDCSLPGSSVHGIPQARILEWVAIPFSRGSSQPRGRTQVSHSADRFFTVWATRDHFCFILFVRKESLGPNPHLRGELYNGWEITGDHLIGCLPHWKIWYQQGKALVARGEVDNNMMSNLLNL